MINPHARVHSTTIHVTMDGQLTLCNLNCTDMLRIGLEIAEIRVSDGKLRTCSACGDNMQAKIDVIVLAWDSIKRSLGYG